MEHCTEKTEHWPNAVAKVSPGKWEQFLFHADNCAFHARLLQAEEDKARAGFLLGKMFEGHGRVLEDPALSETIKELNRRTELMNQVAREREFPYIYISLTNCGELITSSGKLLDFESIHVSKRELSRRDVRAGLQIWGVISEKPDEKVLIGGYPLAGVRHSGEEKLLPINDNFSVGLRVYQLGNRSFRFFFRCVEAKGYVHEEETAVCQDGEKAHGIVEFPGAGKSFLTPIVTKLRDFGSAVIAYIRNPVASQVFAGSLATVALMCALYPLIRGNDAPVIIAADSCRKDQQSEISKALPEAPKPTPTDTLRSDAAEVVAKVDTAAAVVRTQNRTEKTSAAVNKPVKPAVATSNHSTQPPATESTAQRPQQRWLFQAFLKDSAAGGRNFILHSGSDSVLLEKLFAEMEQRNVPVVSLQTNVYFLKPQPFEVRWSITREEKSVTVRAEFMGNGSNRTVSASSDGTCMEDACEKAVRTAVSQLLALMQDQTKESFGSPVGN